MGGLGAASLGALADSIGIERVYGLCSFLPLIGLLAALLPDIEHPGSPQEPKEIKPGSIVR
jgi:FSR family fosmidomycin resistance protein-like MFS transporter